MLLVIADAYAFLWLFLYAHWFLKLWRGEITVGQSDANGIPHADVRVTRIEGDVIHRAARVGLRRVGFALIFILVMLMDWLPTKHPLSAWETVLAGENIVTCSLLVFVIVWLDRLRRLYRPSAPVRLAAGH
jgi:hypothetical protein